MAFPNLVFASENTTNILNGSIVLGDLRGRNCISFYKYEDVKEGMQIIAKNGKGEVLNIGRLKAEKPYEPTFTPDKESGFCQYDFNLELLESDFYIIELGRRGEFSYSKQELKNSGWKLDYYLSSN